MAEWLSLLDADTFPERGDDSMAAWRLLRMDQYAYMDLDDPIVPGLLVALIHLNRTKQERNQGLLRFARLVMVLLLLVAVAAC